MSLQHTVDLLRGSDHDDLEQAMNEKFISLNNEHNQRVSDLVKKLDDMRNKLIEETDVKDRLQAEIVSLTRRVDEQNDLLRNIQQHYSDYSIINKSSSDEVNYDIANDRNRHENDQLFDDDVDTDEMNPLHEDKRTHSDLDQVDRHPIEGTSINQDDNNISTEFLTGSDDAYNLSELDNSKAGTVVPTIIEEQSQIDEYVGRVQELETQLVQMKSNGIVSCVREVDFNYELLQRSDTKQ